MRAFRSDDRVLSLAVLPVQELAALGRVLIAGCLVCLGDVDEVTDARRTLAEFDNLMFIDGTPDHIPWRDAFFTKVLVPPHMKALATEFSNEIHRVLAPDGEIIPAVEDV